MFSDVTLLLSPLGIQIPHGSKLGKPERPVAAQGPCGSIRLDDQIMWSGGASPYNQKFIGPNVSEAFRA